MRIWSQISTSLNSVIREIYNSIYIFLKFFGVVYSLWSKLYSIPKCSTWSKSNKIQFQKYKNSQQQSVMVCFHTGTRQNWKIHTFSANSPNVIGSTDKWPHVLSDIMGDQCLCSVGANPSSQLLEDGGGGWTHKAQTLDIL